MKNRIINRVALALLGAASMLAANTGSSASLAVDLYAKLVYLNPTTGDASATAVAGSIPMWGFAATADGLASVPGPQINVDLTVNDGLAITVHNGLPEPISVVIPSLNGSAEAGQPVRFDAADPNYANRVRSFVPEVANGGSRTFTWTNLKPGTFVYHSGSHPALQVQMGLFGMVTIKVAATQAYPGVALGLGGEVPVIFSEIDPVLHEAVAANDYGAGKTISSTIHSKPSIFLINGRTYDPAGSIAGTPELAPALKNGWTTLFRVINAGWNSHIPSLTGPLPSGSANYLQVIAEDGEPYAYPKTLYAPNMSALKTMDIQFTPPAGAGSQEYQFSDRKLGLANGGGMFRKLAAADEASVCTAAAISVGPTSQGVAPGGNVTFNVTASASSTAPLVYQWRKDGANLAGANSSSLTLVGVTSAASGSYDVLVGNGCGSAISQAAVLSVLPCVAPTLATITPASQSVTYGANVTIGSSFNGSAPLTFQWRKYSGPLSTSTFTVVPGQSSSTLSLSGVTPADAGNYRLFVGNGCGSTLSGNATLAVNCATTLLVGPANLTVPPGQHANFTVAATGSTPLTYQWQKRSGNSGSTFTNVPNGGNVSGATTATLTLTGVVAADAGRYRVLVTNPCGVTVDSGNNALVGNLTVGCATTVILPPANVTTATGTTASFTGSVVTGTTPLTYQWQKRVGNTSTYANVTNGGTISGATTATLTITGVTAADAGRYRVVVTNPCAVSVNSGNTATFGNLTVNP